MRFETGNPSIGDGFFKQKQKIAQDKSPALRGSPSLSDANHAPSNM